MPALPRSSLLVLLALLMGGCATAAGGRAPSFAALGLPDRYALARPDAPAPGPGELDRCWAWLGDPTLAAAADAAPADRRLALARRYVELRRGQTAMTDLRAFLDAGAATLQIARFREEARLVTARDTVQLDAEQAAGLAVLAGLRSQTVSDAARIAAAAGGDETLIRALAAPAPVPAGPRILAIGRPSGLLARRPDLARAAQRAGGWLNVNPGRSREALRRTVLAAVADVEDARADLDAAEARARGLEPAVDKANDLAILVRQQYREGLADYGALSAAEKSLLNVHDALSAARAARETAALDLCAALGGGGGGAAATNPGS